MSEPRMRLADFGSIAEALAYAATGSKGMAFHNARGHCLHEYSYKDVYDRANAIAARLLGQGLKRGARVGIIAAMGPDFVDAFFGCQMAGMLAVPLPVITGLGGRQGYEEQLGRVLATSRVAIAIGPEESIESLTHAGRGLGDLRIMTHRALDAAPASREVLQPLGPEEASHIQFSSGSTQSPKGVVISQNAMMTNARAIVNPGLELRPDDRIASWLPFYHDMGLIGHMIAPVTGQMHVDYLLTDDFAKRPMQWLQMISDKRSTISFSPTFGYDICADRLRGNTPDINLSHWRIAGIGGEMVKPETMVKFAEAYRPFGFDPNALMPCYGMAEATLAVTFTPVGKGLKIDHIDKTALSRGEAKAMSANGVTRDFASCGVPLGDMQVEVRGEGGECLSERRIGIVHLKSESLMDGYDANPAANAEVFDADGWLNTGDMGYLADGELYLTGRAKDMMIVNGRNVWPQDLEWLAEQQVAGLRRRDTAAFAVEGDNGTEQPVILIQCRMQEPAAREALRGEVQSLLARQIGVPCRVVLVPPKSLPFTTSGKLSRAKARSSYLAGEYAMAAEAEVERREPQSAVG